MSAIAAQNGASTAPDATTSSSGKPSVQPTEVGWLFVPQYYTFLNNDPNKLHCFYTKKSTLVHGTEQEDSSLCFGQQVRMEKERTKRWEWSKVLIVKHVYPGSLLSANSRQDCFFGIL
jgi:hypothetical protein